MGLIIAMAAISPTATIIHPDEQFHFVAHHYFTSNWLPPAVDDPATLATVSDYGYSYLFELDLVYLISAYLISPLAKLFTEPLDAARAFNLALFAGLIAMMVFRSRWTPCLSLLLISPQVWYVFAYFNADAFPLALGILAAAIAGDRDNALHAYLERAERVGMLVFGFAVLLALLLLSKRNYLPLVPGIFLWLAAIHVGVGAASLALLLGGATLLCLYAFAGQMTAWAGSGGALILLVAGISMLGFGGWLFVSQAWRQTQRRAAMTRWLLLLLITITIALPRVVWDLAVNGSPANRASTIEQVMEERAAVPFKPSVVADGRGFEGRNIAARGVTMKQLLFEPYNWVTLSTRSAFGVYGFMDQFGPNWLYRALMLTAFLAALLAAIAVVRAHGKLGISLVAIVAGIGALVVMVSILHSWTFDLQRQGRYLFPLLPLLGLMVGAGIKRLPYRVFTAIVLVAACLSTFSFLAYGIAFAARA